MSLLKSRAASVTSLLLLKDLIKSVSPATAGRLALFASILLHRAPPGRLLDTCPPTTPRRAGRGGGWEDKRAVDGVWCDAEGAGGTGGDEGSGRAAPQLPEAGALLQASSSSSSSSSSSFSCSSLWSYTVNRGQLHRKPFFSFFLTKLWHQTCCLQHVGLNK